MAGRTPGGLIAMGAAALVAALAVAPASAFHRYCRAYDCRIPFEWEDQPPPLSDNPPLPQGFVLTVPVGREPADGPLRGDVLNRYADVAWALGRCWNPGPSIGGSRWGEITLRVSFRRDGRVNGIPRVPYMSGVADQSAGAELRSSLLSALAQCTPLHLSASLGNAIAGQIFAIRFVQQGNS